MPELDWIIEYETLPPEEPELQSPEPPSPRRRLPRWFWLALATVAAVAALVAYLWQLGARGDPLPGPDATATSLESVVQLEIDALNTGDDEIYSRLQDIPSRRRHVDPPSQNWFGIEQSKPGKVELVDIELVAEDSAVATVKVTWNETVYRHVWFYRREEGTWRHTDWQQLDLGQQERLTTPHFEIVYHAAEAEQASALASRLEAFVADFCGLLPCLFDSESLSLEIEVFDPAYHAAEISPWHYRISSPYRIRWPWDNQPEPVVLASIGRHLAYDLFLNDVEQGLPRENQVPLTLATFWLVHHLLDSDSAPGTRWLDEAASRDGLPAAHTFIVSLAEGVEPPTALAASFGPRTAATVAALPDYFGWLLFQNPTTILRGSPGYDADFRWPRYILSQFDSSAEPWASDDRSYDYVMPQVTSVEYQSDWAIVAIAYQGQPESVRFFRLADGIWSQSRPDATFLGPAKTDTVGNLVIYYYSWDESFIPELSQVLEHTYRTITADYGLVLDRPIIVSVEPNLDVSVPDPQVNRDILIGSPRLTGQYEAAIGQAVYELGGLLLTEAFDVNSVPEERVLLMLGGFLWEMDRLGYGLETYLALLNGPDWVDEWEPPATVNAPEWIPLLKLWTSTPSEWEDTEILDGLHYSDLVVRYIAEIYGTDKVPLLLETLPTATTMDEWSKAVTGQPLERLEADWRIWVVEHWVVR